jgi:hypothetical protein
LIIMISVWVWWLFPIGAFGVTFGCCAHFAAIIVTGVFRYSTEG